VKRLIIGAAGVVALVVTLTACGSSGGTHAAVAGNSPSTAYTPIFDGNQACGSCTGDPVQDPGASGVPTAPSPSPSGAPLWSPPSGPGCSLDEVLVDEYGCDAYDSTDSCDYLWTYHGDIDSLIENPFGLNGSEVKAKCPQYLKAYQQSLTGFPEGAEVVGKHIKPGTYEPTAFLTHDVVTNCYWSRSRNGHIIANNFIDGATHFTVTIRSTDDVFTSQGCGDWILVHK
jgi:hypothetical protein